MQSADDEYQIARCYLVDKTQAQNDLYQLSPLTFNNHWNPNTLEYLRLLNNKKSTQKELQELQKNIIARFKPFYDDIEKHKNSYALLIPHFLHLGSVLFYFGYADNFSNAPSTIILISYLYHLFRVVKHHQLLHQQQNLIARHIEMIRDLKGPEILWGDRRMDRYEVVGKIPEGAFGIQIDKKGKISVTKKVSLIDPHVSTVVCRSNDKK
jgi:hypothetical protein